MEFTPDDALQTMRTLSSWLCLQGNKKKPFRIIEDPTPDQAEIRVVFGDKTKRGTTGPFMITSCYL